MLDRLHSCGDGWVHRTFGSAWIAFGTLFGTMGLLLAIYIGVHAARTVPSIPWNSAVKISNDGRFHPRYQVAVLERFFSEKELLRLKTIIDQRCEEARDEILVRRRLLLSELRKFYKQHLAVHPPQDRPTVMSPSDPARSLSHINVSRSSLGIMRLGEEASGKPDPTGFLGGKLPEQWTDKEVLILSLSELVLDLQNALLNVSAETRSIGDRLVVKLQAQNSEESIYRKEITEEISALEPPLSFSWFYHAGAGWVFEVVFWTWFGVIANSVIAVIVNCKKGEYHAGLFSMFIPKFFLAPLLSVVFVALWSSGMTQSKVTYLNLPWFMAFCFFLGFMTESLYARLRKFADAILGGATEASGMLPGGPGQNYHQWRRPRVLPGDLVVAGTLPELKTQLKRVANAEMEHSIIEGKGQ